MTQTSTGPRPAVPVAVAASVVPAARRPAPGPARRVAGLLAGPRGRLRVAAAVSALVCVALALLGASALQVRANALEDARRDAAQLVRVQEAASDLARADAAVTNGFLVAGAEPVALTAQYDEAVASASRRLVDAAAAAPQDRADLARANALLVDYSRMTAHARDQNREGRPLGSGYLVIASQDLLRGQIDPLLDRTAAATADRVDAAFDRADAAGLRFTAGALPAIVGLLAVQLWLARRTRRVLNLGLVAASVAVAVAVVAGSAAMASAASTAQDVASTSYRQVQGLATARNAAYSAKGLESLTLVKQGGGATYEAAWVKERDAVAAGLAEAADAGAEGARGLADGPLAAWTTTHELIRTLDTGGDWPTAVVVATRAAPAADPPAANGRASTTDFTALVDGIDGLLDAQVPAVTDALGRPWVSLQIAGWSILVLGLLAAVAAVAGISQRLGEYR